MKVIRMRLTSDSLYPSNLRFNTDTNTYQQTPDGGVTWNDAPENDPRHADGFRRPITPTSNTQCDAAARMVAYVQDVVTNFEQSVAAAQMAVDILNLIALLVPGAGEIWLLINLVIAAAGIAIDIGSADIEAAFSPTTYDTLKCIFYDNIDADGSMSASQLTTIQNNILAVFGSGVVYNIMNQVGLFTGEVGYSNAAAERSNTGDCTSCLPPLDLICWDDSPGRSCCTINNLGGGRWEIIGGPRPTVPDNQMGFEDANGNCINITDVENIVPPEFDYWYDCAGSLHNTGLVPGNYRQYEGTTFASDSPPHVIITAFASP